MDIVYRVGGDGYQCALFAQRENAERVAQAFTALRESKTWGEFRARLPLRGMGARTGVSLRGSTCR